jgi:Amt family ammonium transporter
MVRGLTLFYGGLVRTKNVLGTMMHAFGAIQLKTWLGYDDSLDVFGIHRVAGVVGAIALCAFLRHLPEHGVLVQLWYQIKGVLVAVAFSVVVPYVLVKLVDKTVGLRLSEREEIEGLEHGEHGYGLLHLN